MKRKNISVCVFWLLFTAVNVSVSAGTITETEVDLSRVLGLGTPDFTLTFNEGQADEFEVSAGGISCFEQPFTFQQQGCGVSLPTFSRDFPVWSMVGTSNDQTGYEDGSTWVEVTAKGDATLLSVDMSCIAVLSGGGVFTVGYSSGDGDYQDGELVGFLPGSCTGYSALSPAGKSIRSIRLVRSRNFAGQQTNDVSGAVSIKSLAVRMGYVTTGLGGSEGESFHLRATAQEISSSQACRMEIYSLSGRLVQSDEHTTSLPVDHLSGGIYLVKAVNAKGEEQLLRFAR